MFFSPSNSASTLSHFIQIKFCQDYEISLVQEWEAKGGTAYLNMNLISKKRILKKIKWIMVLKTQKFHFLTWIIREGVKHKIWSFFLLLYLTKRGGGGEECSNFKDTDIRNHPKASLHGQGCGGNMFCTWSTEIGVS